MIRSRFILLHLVLFLFIFYSFNRIFEFFSFDNDDFCTITTASGEIRGKVNYTLLAGQRYFSFRGIPYAKPPINELRFKAPQPIEPWAGKFDAFKQGTSCIGYVVFNVTLGDWIGEEDCLYLNVFVPTNSTSIDVEAKLPVIFHIYGDGYLHSLSSYHRPDFLMEENIIVVVATFRTGPFGFLKLNSPEYSGNMGYKDQALALKWTYDNIGFFGGDKDQITLVGHSTGAIAVNLHMISTHSNQFFKRAIALSASALNPFVEQRPEVGRNLMYKLAEEMKHPVSSEEDLIEFLKVVDAETLFKRTCIEGVVSADGTGPSHGWAAAVEDANVVDPFLTRTPFDIMTDPNYQSEIDVLFGRATQEMVSYDAQLNSSLLKIIDEAFYFEMPLGNATIEFNSDAHTQIAKRIRDFYFVGKSIDSSNLDRLDDLISDIIFLYGIDLGARIQSKKSSGRTLFSKFSVDNEWNLSNRRRRASDNRLKFDTHADQVYCMHRFSLETTDEVYESLKTNEPVRRIVKRVTNFYANFAKFGRVFLDQEPVEFQASPGDEIKYYDITDDGIFVKVDDQRDSYEFWDDLFNDFKHLWNITFDFHKLE